MTETIGTAADASPGTEIDVDETLGAIRRAVQDFDNESGKWTAPVRMEHRAIIAAQGFEHFEQLDQALTQGGPLPRAWLAHRTADPALLEVLHRAQSAQNRAALVELVTAHVVETFPGRTALGVVFTASEWDDGFYLDELSATVYLADARPGLGDAIERTESLAFGDLVRDALTEEFGVVGHAAGAAVDLRIGEVHFDHDASRVHATFAGR